MIIFGDKLGYSHKQVETDLRSNAHRYRKMARANWS